MFTALHGLVLSHFRRIHPTFSKQASSTPRLASQTRPVLVVKMLQCYGASCPQSYPTRTRAATESPGWNASVLYIETNVTFFMLADEPHWGQMKASPTEKERSRQRRPATGWTTGVLCCLNAIIFLSIQSIFGNKTRKLYISWLSKPTAVPAVVAGLQQGLAWSGWSIQANADFGDYEFKP